MYYKSPMGTMTPGELVFFHDDCWENKKWPVPESTPVIEEPARYWGNPDCSLCGEEIYE